MNMRAYELAIHPRRAANASVVVFIKELLNVVEHFLHKNYFYLAGMMQSLIEDRLNSNLMVFS